MSKAKLNSLAENARDEVKDDADHSRPMICQEVLEMMPGREDFSAHAHPVFRVGASLRAPEGPPPLGQNRISRRRHKAAVGAIDQ